MALALRAAGCPLSLRPRAPDPVRGGELALVLREEREVGKSTGSVAREGPEFQ